MFIKTPILVSSNIRVGVIKPAPNKIIAHPLNIPDSTHPVVITPDV
jgi:hypothetical protein